MTSTHEINHKQAPRWSDLLSLQLTLLGSLAGCYGGYYLFFYIWDRGPFLPAVIGLCAGLGVIILTRRGGLSVGFITAFAALIMQLIAHHETRPIGMTDFLTFLGKLPFNLHPWILLAHLPGLLLAAGISGLLPRLWKKR